MDQDRKQWEAEIEDLIERVWGDTYVANAWFSGNPKIVGLLDRSWEASQTPGVTARRIAELVGGKEH